MAREVLNPGPRAGYDRPMLKAVATGALATIALVLAGSADAQTSHRQQREPKEVEHPAPAVPIDKRDSVVTAAGAFTGRPYWLALAQCGGIYFKLNLLYTDIAVHARSVKPDPKLNAEFTKKLNEAIKTATVYFDGAEHFLMTDRGLERVDAVLVYDDQSRAAGDRFKTIDAALTAAQACPALYQVCQEAYSKACSEPLSPVS
jgi:hypothetical protein